MSAGTGPYDNYNKYNSYSSPTPSDAGARPRNSYPPLAPGEETPLPIDPAFRDKCYDAIRHVRANVIFNNVYFSESDEWGKILRIDLVFPDDPIFRNDDSSGRVNRVICFQRPNEELTIVYTVGQKIAPLPDSKEEK